MKYIVTKASLEKDRREIVALLSRNFEGSFRERYSWIYESNPAGAGTCLIARDLENQRIVGSTALFPRRLLIDGEAHLAGIAGDFSVDESHRGFGPALALQREVISGCPEKDFELLYGFPNKHSGPLQLRAGYKPIGKIMNLTKPLTSSYFLSRYIRNHRVRKPLSKLADVCLKYCSRETYSGSQNAYAVETPSFFDKRYDIFWEKARDQFRVIGERNSSYLNWRFIQAPHRNYQVRSLIEKQTGDIAGYIVFDTKDRTVSIVDLLCLDMQEKMDAMLSKFILYQRKQKMDSIRISFFGNAAFVKKLQKYNFSVRKPEGSLIVYLANSSLSPSSLMDGNNWYWLPGDNDV